MIEIATPSMVLMAGGVLLAVMTTDRQEDGEKKNCVRCVHGWVFQRGVQLSRRPPYCQKQNNIVGGVCDGAERGGAGGRDYQFGCVH